MEEVISVPNRYSVYARFEFQVSSNDGTKFMDAIIMGEDREIKGYFRRGNIESKEKAFQIVDDYMAKLRGAIGNLVYAYPKEKDSLPFTLENIHCIKREITLEGD